MGFRAKDTPSGLDRAYPGQHQRQEYRQTVCPEPEEELDLPPSDEEASSSGRYQRTRSSAPLLRRNSPETPNGCLGSSEAEAESSLLPGHDPDSLGGGGEQQHQQGEAGLDHKRHGSTGPSSLSYQNSDNHDINTGGAMTRTSVDTTGYNAADPLPLHGQGRDDAHGGSWEDHDSTPGCCRSTSGGCFFSGRGGCCFSDREGCFFSDRGGCCFSDRGGCFSFGFLGGGSCGRK